MHVVKEELAGWRLLQYFRICHVVVVVVVVVAPICCQGLHRRADRCDRIKIDVRRVRSFDCIRTGAVLRRVQSKLRTLRTSQYPNTSILQIQTKGHLALVSA